MIRRDNSYDFDVLHKELLDKYPALRSYWNKHACGLYEKKINTGQSKSDTKKRPSLGACLNLKH